MANDVVQNPYVLDTSATVIASGQAVQIRALKVVDMTAAGDSILVADANDNQFWEHHATAANESSPMDDFSNFPVSKRTLNGLKVTIGSGKLYVWLG